MSPLLLSKMPPSCGYTVKAMERDLILVAPYDGCFVAVEVGSNSIKPIRTLGKVTLAYQCVLLLLQLCRRTVMFFLCVCLGCQ